MIEPKIEAADRHRLGMSLAEMGGMRCEEIMKRRLCTARPETTVTEAAQLMKLEQIGFVPVCDSEGCPLGVLTDRDIVLRACAESLPENTRVSQIMTHHPVTCAADDDVERAEALMVERKTRRVLVTDASGALVGLITLADIAQYQAPFKTARWLRELTARRFRVEH